MRKDKLTKDLFQEEIDKLIVWDDEAVEAEIEGDKKKERVRREEVEND